MTRLRSFIGDNVESSNKMFAILTNKTDTLDGLPAKQFQLVGVGVSNNVFKARHEPIIVYSEVFLDRVGH